MAAGLVPVFHKNKPFFGLYTSGVAGSPPVVHQVDWDTPAASAGFQIRDRALRVDGAPAEYANLNARLDALKPGESVRVLVQRENRELELTATGIEPPIAMIYLPSIWHPIFGVFGFALALLIYATEPMKPPPLWRPALLVLAGLGIGIGFGIDIFTNNFFATLKVAQLHTLNFGERLHFGQSYVGAGASFLLAALGAMELRGTLEARGQAAPSTPPPI